MTSSDYTTLGQLFLHTVTGPPKPDLLRSKVEGRWVGISSAELKTAVEELAGGLLSLGVKRGDRVALLSENRPQWLISDYATHGIGAVIVPIYTTLIPKAIGYILQDSGSVGVVVSNQEQARKIHEVRSGLPDLRFVIGMDPGIRDVPDVTPWDAVCAEGREHLRGEPDFYTKGVAVSQPGDVATLIYTSGTTGKPKGVMLTHDALVSNVKSVGSLVSVNASDVGLSFLPLSHVLERMVDYLYMANGTTIAYAESVEKVPENMMEVKPTLMVSVPRLYEKMYARVMDRGRTAHGLQKAIFWWALGVAQAFVKQKIGGRELSGFLAFKYRLADKLVFRKIRERTGGRLRFFISGGAPLAREIAEFFYGLGVLILEGYGLTETSPVIAVNTPTVFKLGTVGKPIPGVEVKIANDGEVLCKGPNVMIGYFNKEQATKDAFEQGWFKTGDIGHLDEDGYLHITDRKKDLFKTSGGKFIAPQPIENGLKADDIVSQAVVIGDGRKFAAALLVANIEVVRKRLPGQALPEDPIALVADSRVRQLFDQHVAAVNEGLSNYERIKKYELLPHEFSLETGELTPTLKVKRKVVTQRYAQIIERIYAEPTAG